MTHVVLFDLATATLIGGPHDGARQDIAACPTHFLVQPCSDCVYSHAPCPDPRWVPIEPWEAPSPRPPHFALYRLAELHTTPAGERHATYRYAELRADSRLGPLTAAGRRRP